MDGLYRVRETLALTYKNAKSKITPASFSGDIETIEQNEVPRSTGCIKKWPSGRTPTS
jgi:hypothetical protein